MLLAQGIIALLAAGLTTAGQLNQTSPAVGTSRQLERLASGAASAAALRDIAARADDYYQDVIQRTIQQGAGSHQAREVPRLIDHIVTPPGWSEAYLAFSRRIGRVPHLATEILRFAELVLLEGHVAQRDTQPALNQQIPGDEGYMRAALALAAAFCSRVWEMEDEMLSALTAGNGARPPVVRASAEGSRAASPGFDESGDMEGNEGSGDPLPTTERRSQEESRGSTEGDQPPERDERLFQSS